LGGSVGLEKPQPSGWSYPLAPRLVLRTSPRPPGADRALKVLLVRSGEAFPPGHPTTRLCLDLLLEALTTASVNSLLDVGCGSGVLGLSAAALGVPRVVGADISGRAARVTLDNAGENALGASVRVVQGSTECLKAPFDLVVANLPWDVQTDKVAELDRLAAVEGRLILSGFRDQQEGPLRESYLRLGWSLRRRLVRDFSHPEQPAHISFNWVAWLLG
jgi:ribosomal protein L11 methylase PrmA